MPDLFTVGGERLATEGDGVDFLLVDAVASNKFVDGGGGAPEVEAGVEFKVETLEDLLLIFYLIGDLKKDWRRTHW